MARAKTLTPDEMAALVTEVRAGGRRRDRALERILAAHEPIIRIASTGMARGGVEPEDALQTCRMLAWQALQGWNPDGGASPGTWIAHRLRGGSLHDQVVRQRAAAVRMPLTSSWRKGLSRYRDAVAAFEAARGRPPEPGEVKRICEAAGIDHSVIEQIQNLSAPALRLDQPVVAFGDDGARTNLGDTLADERTGEDVLLDRLEDEERRAKMERCMSALDPRDRDILRARFGLDTGEPERLEVIAKRHGVTRARIGQILERAVVDLRAEMTGRPRAEVREEARRAHPEEGLTPRLIVLDLSGAVQAGLPGIGENAPAPAAQAAPTRRRAPRARRARPRPQDARQSCLLALLAGATPDDAMAGSISLAA
jgi:RNA polymerase primary sigma factor